MQTLISMLLAASPSPAPSPLASVDPATTFYSPGTIGFIATFGLAVAAGLLIFDLVRRVRRVRYRSEIEAKLDAEATDGGGQGN